MAKFNRFQQRAIELFELLDFGYPEIKDQIKAAKSLLKKSLKVFESFGETNTATYHYHARVYEELKTMKVELKQLKNNWRICCYEYSFKPKKSK
jgi:hypothetical protein